MRGKKKKNCKDKCQAETSSILSQFLLLTLQCAQKSQAVEKRVKRLGRWWRALSVKGAKVGI